LRTWLREQGRALREALRRLSGQAVGLLLTVLVIGIAGALPLGLLLATQALGSLTRGLGADPQLTVFATPGAAARDVEALGERLRRHPAAAGVRLVGRDQALESLRRDAGLAELIDDLGRNPLPDAWVVTGRAADAAGLEALRAEAAGWPGVDQVQLDADWARQLEGAVNAARRVALFLGALLGVALVAVSFNTIRLQVLTQRDEIEVVKLIGATDGFVRRPFLYFGVLQGGASGLVAFAVVAGAGALLRHGLPGAEPGFAAALGSGLPGPATLLLAVAVGGALGWFGAWLSVSEHLRRLDPRE
jgi:cell division transport system permease protein